MLICIFYEFSAAYSTNCRSFLYLVLLIFRVGGKDKPTRFLSFVEAVHGFRHLLTQDDLDRAMSLCTSLKGHLKSKFLVLSDDRILPPYQPKSGKRSHPDNSSDSVPGKRTHQDPGVSGAQASAASATSTAPAASFSSVVQTHLIPGVSVIQASAASATSAPPANFVSFGGASGTDSFSTSYDSGPSFCSTSIIRFCSNVSPSSPHHPASCCRTRRIRGRQSKCSGCFLQSSIAPEGEGASPSQDHNRDDKQRKPPDAIPCSQGQEGRPCLNGNCDLATRAVRIL